MGLLRREKHVMVQRQIPGPVPTGTGIGGALTIDPNEGTVASTLQTDADVAPGGGFTTAPQLASGITPTITLSFMVTPPPSLTPVSSSISASSSTVAPISVSTVVGSCVGAFIGAVALVCLGFWFYRQHLRSLKSQYLPKGRDPVNARASMQRRHSRREPWDKLEGGNTEDKWEGRTKTEESVGPMEKLTMFKKAPSVWTAYTHTEEEPVQFEMSHPFSQQDSNDHESASIPPPKPFTASNTWDDPQGSFLSVRTQSERLSGSMSPSLTMAIPTPPATASPQYNWESAEIVNIEGQRAEIVNPFADDNKPFGPEKRKSSGNPFFGAHEDIPRRRSRSNSLVSKSSRVSRARSVSESIVTPAHIPVPKIDKGKGRAIDPFDDENAHGPFNTISRSHPTVDTSLPVITSTHPTPISPLAPPRPMFAAHHASPSTSSAASSEHAMASLIAALDGATTTEEVQARLRIVSIQPSIHSTYSDATEGPDVSKDFPLPPSTPGQSTSTFESFVTAESDRTLKSR